MVDLHAVQLVLERVMIMVKRARATLVYLQVEK